MQNRYNFPLEKQRLRQDLIVKVQEMANITNSYYRDSVVNGTNEEHSEVFKAIHKFILSLKELVIALPW